MRSTVKNRIISNALKQQGSLAFTRGRMLGQAETEAKWQLKDKKNRAKEMLGLDTRHRRKKEDWSQYDASHLEKKLIDRHVIQRTGGDSDSLVYSQAMIELSEQCIRHSKLNVDDTSTGPAEANDIGKNHDVSSSQDSIKL
jgi:hypothetical protein